MRNYFQDGYVSIKKALYDDKFNLFIVGTYCLLFLASYLIWNLYLENVSIFVYAMEDIYPVKYLAVVLLINTVLGLFAYEKEKEISYLLFGSNIFMVVLILILEIFYLSNMSNV